MAEHQYDEILRLRDSIHRFANDLMAHEYRLQTLEKLRPELERLVSMQGARSREWSVAARLAAFCVGLLAAGASLAVIVSHWP